MSQFVDRNHAATQANLRGSVEQYFGAHPDDAENADIFGLVPRADQDQELYRVSYLFLLVFGSDDEEKEMGTEYGGMQLRAETHLWLENGEVPLRLQKLIQQAAHRAAHIYDSSVETPKYGATSWASGYLSGFDPWENGEDYDNWEVEPVARQEVHNPPGVIDWTTEIYLDVDGLDYANLSGLATGLANPWQATTTTEEGQAPVDVPGTKWVIGWEEGRDPPEYYVRAQPGTAAGDRYRDGAGAGKTVYINEMPIGSLGPKGRVWLRDEYQRGDPRFSKGSWGTNWSREGLVQESVATYQAIRKDGVLYQTGETEGAVYLVTARAKPDDWREVDPDEVPVDLEVRDGGDDREITVLGLDQPGTPMKVAAREDREVIKHMGESSPPYTHVVRDFFRLPDFRMVEPAHISTRDEDRDDGQASLGEYGGES